MRWFVEIACLDEKSFFLCRQEGRERWVESRMDEMRMMGNLLGIITPPYVHNSTRL